ncbi:hypothetical protein EYF80_013708 [Liparis tanakae]|uniref:Uncharacterized protein n=1 Tax=Liparis tanakae TaxID=230148 RepID=A0A4Z2IE45_9TELE|nr:hypothetical protein EYF80_013708 [Liparis tanakae]
MEATSMMFKVFPRNFLQEGATISLMMNSAEKPAMQISSRMARTGSSMGTFELGQVFIDSRELLKGGLKTRLLLVVAHHVPVSVINVILPLVVPVATAGAYVELLDSPVLDLLAEGEDAHLLHHVDASCVVEVEHAEENMWIPVEVVLLLGRAVVVTQFQDRRLALAAQQTGQARVREAEQHARIYFVSNPSHVEVHLVLLIPPPVENLPIPHDPDNTYRQK